MKDREKPTGITRLLRAFGYSFHGFHHAWREEAAFRALHPGFHNRAYEDALRYSPRSTVLVQPGSSRMHFIGGLSEAWVTLNEAETRSVDFELIQATNRFVTFDEFGRREYALLVQELRARFGVANVRPASDLD